MCWKKITCTTGEKIHNHENANLMDLRCVSTAGYFQRCFHCESINLNEKAAEQMLFCDHIKAKLVRKPSPARREYFGKYLFE